MTTYVEKIHQLPEPIATFFLSDKPRYELEKSCYMYGMNDDVIAKIAPILGAIYVNDIILKDFPAILNKEIPLSQGMSHGIAYEINRNIFNKFYEYFKDAKILMDQWARLKAEPMFSEAEAWKKVLESEPHIKDEEQAEKELELKNKNKEEEQKIQRVSLVPEEAYRQFPEMGDQLITTELIKIQSSASPARPSIKNWLSDYTFKLGFGAHSSMERSNYLFQDENAKSLNFQDKQKLSYILKAYDEKTPLTINKITKTVVFPNVSATQTVDYSRPKNNMGIQDRPAEKNDPISFSYSQKLPYEKMQTEKQSPAPIVLPKKEIPASPVSRNVVNLKELG